MTSPSSEIRGACPGCGKDVAAGRCEACGAVVRVRGYRMIRVLAQGQGGRTYLAENEDGEKVTLKELVLLEAPADRWIEHFERQARVLARLSHPRLPRWLDAFDDGDGIHKRLFLAQEYIEGESLLERLSHHRYSEEEALAVARKVLSILLHLHRQRPRLIHRDIKPANLVVDATGAVFLVDFGSALEMPHASAKGRTQTGTIGYAPVEQLGGTVTEWCDLHALGATLLHLLTRTPPWELVRDGRVRTDTRSLDVSPRLRGFLDRLLAEDERERITTAVEALRALDELELGAPKEPRRVGLLAGGAMAALAVVALVGVFSGGGPSGGDDGDLAEQAEPPVAAEPPAVHEHPVPAEPPVAAEPEVAAEPPAPIEAPEEATQDPLEIDVNASVLLDSIYVGGDISFKATSVRVVPRPRSRSHPLSDVIIEGRCESAAEGAKPCPPLDWVVLQDEDGRPISRSVAFFPQSTTTSLSTIVPPTTKRVLLTFGRPASPDGRWLLDLERRELRVVP